MKHMKQSICYSALWSAYGDALGFITELADHKTLKKRINDIKINRTIQWKRLIGGRFGVIVELPEGCYSDDTQLRLSTSRCIRSDGVFDVEAFAKIELPIWLSYSLGAGVGSRLAANSLSKLDINWFSNFFDSNNKSYLNAGGDGAAMRIQPHIWASASKSSYSFLKDVIRNSICTHGHFRGILGAVFHALSLSYTIDNCYIPSINTLLEFVDLFDKTIEFIENDNEISAFWLPAWESKSNLKIDEAIKSVKRECVNDIEILFHYADEKPEIAYEKGLTAIGGLKPESRGSGTKTAIIASFLSYLFKNEDPHDALKICANTLNSDTDTIATMAGSILGAIALEEPKGKILDKDYILYEAERMYKISKEENTTDFLYPDLFQWRAPKAQVDSIGYVSRDIALAGIGLVKPISEEYKTDYKDNNVWQWFETTFGQSILAKKRTKPSLLPKGNIPTTQKGFKQSTIFSGAININKPKRQETESIDRNEASLSTIKDIPQKSDKGSTKKDFSINELTQEAINSNFNATLIGKHILFLCENQNGIESAIAYAAIIAKARIARQSKLK